MLKYLFIATELLIPLALMVGLIEGYGRKSFNPAQLNVLRLGEGLGLLFALVMTWMKTYTSRVDTGLWNLRIYAALIVFFLIWIITTILSGRFEKGGRWGAACALAAILALMMLDLLPEVLSIPHTILLTEESVLSTAFLLKLTGALLGITLAFISGLALQRCTETFTSGEILPWTVLAILITLLEQIAKAFGILLAKRLIPGNHTLFVLSKNASNHSDFFIYLTMAVALVLPLRLWIKSLKVNEPYQNPAEKRKILAKWRRYRRWLTTVILSFTLIIVVLTVVQAEAKREVVLSPIEETKIEGDEIRIPFEQVNDGHLHRFGYETENGVVIRFIVIQKPNSSAYGIGLDACDICGETGYYEKDGQVVCNLCDVVMNINTIGFKGGCNPIVFEYRIENGHIVIPIENLLPYEKEFK